MEASYQRTAHSIHAASTILPARCRRVCTRRRAGAARRNRPWWRSTRQPVWQRTMRAGPWLWLVGDHAHAHRLGIHFYGVPLTQDSASPVFHGCRGWACTRASSQSTSPSRPAKRFSRSGGPSRSRYRAHGRSTRAGGRLLGTGLAAASNDERRARLRDNDPALLRSDFRKRKGQRARSGRSYCRHPWPSRLRADWSLIFWKGLMWRSVVSAVLGATRAVRMASEMSDGCRSRSG